MRVNYTTYDLRCAQDSLNSRTHADIMVLSQDEDNNSHPYWYARVVGIFHAMVFHSGPLSCSSEPQHMEFLLVRWFGRNSSKAYRGGWKRKRLHQIGFVDDEDSPAFG